MNSQEVGSSYTLDGKSESLGGKKLNDFVKEYNLASFGLEKIEIED